MLPAAFRRRQRSRGSPGDRRRRVWFRPAPARLFVVGRSPADRRPGDRPDMDVPGRVLVDAARLGHQAVQVNVQALGQVRLRRLCPALDDAQVPDARLHLVPEDGLETLAFLKVERPRLPVFVQPVLRLDAAAGARWSRFP